MKVKLSVSHLQSISALMAIAAEAIKQRNIPAEEGKDEPIMANYEAMFHFINVHEALKPYIDKAKSKQWKNEDGCKIVGEDEAVLIANLPPKVKEILEKLSESGAKVEVMKVETQKS